MKSILLTIFMALPLAKAAEEILCFNLFPGLPGCATCPKEICFKHDNAFELCPYEDCVDECVGGSLPGSCNPSDGCDPGLGCSIGCAIAC